MDFFAGGDLRHLLITYGYLAIFLVVAVEAMGIPVPGETMLVLASVYAGTTHHLSIGLVIMVAAAGAILGDNLGFLAGRYGGYRLLRRYGRYVRLDERKLQRGRYLFDRHGGKMVFFGRFLPILRVWAAFLAGTNRMGRRRFLVYNTAGGAVWATAVGLGSYVFGASLLRSGGLAGVLSAVAAAVVIAVISLSRRRRERSLSSHPRSIR